MVSKKVIDNEEKVAYWRRQLEVFAKYPGSQAQFCRESNVCPHLLHYWRKKLVGSVSKRQLSVRRSSFVPVSIERLPLVMSSSAPRLPDARWLAEFILRLQQGGAA